MRQLIVYIGWFSIVSSGIGLALTLRQPARSDQRRHVYVGQILGALGSLLLGLALTQFNNITWFAWLCLNVGCVLALLSFVILVRGRKQA